MKKILASVMAAGFLFAQFAAPALCAGLVDYSTDFETAASYSWATLNNTDTSGVATTDWSEVVTKAYGTDTDNKALSIRTGASYITERGSFDTLSYGTVVDNPVLGNSVYSFDFMVDSAVSSLENHTLMNFASVQLSGTNTASVQVIRLIKRASGCNVWLPNDTDLGLVAFDKWNRVTMAYNPVTGKAKFTLIKDVDNAVSAQTSEVNDYQLAAANAHTGINRITFSMNRDNLQFYFDNVSIFNYNATALTASTPASGAQDFMPVDTIRLAFNNKLTALNLSVGATPVTASSWIEGTDNTYSYKPAVPLAWNTDYTLSGNVTDIYGNIVPVSLSFKTPAQPQNLIEIVGFYEDDNADTSLTEDEKLSALESGTITAKLRFWQTQEASYTYFMGFYRDNNGKPEMLDVVADTVTSSEIYADKALQLTIPTEYTDCSIRLYFLNNMTDRAVFGSSATVGDTILR